MWNLLDVWYPTKPRNQLSLEEDVALDEIMVNLVGGHKSIFLVLILGIKEGGQRLKCAIMRKVEQDKRDART